MQPACELPPEGGSYGVSVIGLSARRLSSRFCSCRLSAEVLISRFCSFRLQAEVLILVVLLAGCGAGRARTADDLTTTTEVKIALLSDARLGGQRLEVSTHQGVVLLSGTVRTRVDELQAIALAKKIRGVRDVKSELKVQE